MPRLAAVWDMHCAAHQYRMAAAGLSGARRYERSAGRATWRNSHCERTLDTRLGSLQLVSLLRGPAPKLRQGSCFLPFLEPRKTSERALVAVTPEAWVAAASRPGT